MGKYEVIQHPDFDSMLDRVERGEDVVFTRDGEPVAHLVAMPRPYRTLSEHDIEAFEAVHARYPALRGTFALIRNMRDAADR